MELSGQGTAMETRIDDWRAFLLRKQAISSDDADELEDHLRTQIADLSRSGLDEEESFLIALRRMGDTDAISAEYAHEHGDRLWKQLSVAPRSGGAAAPNRELVIVLALATAAGLATRLAVWLFTGAGPLASSEEMTLLREASFFVVPFVLAYFAWKRRLRPAAIAAVGGAFAATVVLANVYPFSPGGDTQFLTVAHTQVLLWAIVGIAYMGGRWRTSTRRMDFVRFTGELAVYLALIALGGGVLLGLTLGSFALVGVAIGDEAMTWLLSLCVPGAVIVATWLVEAKQNVIENIAPVLTRVFTPLTAIMLLALLGALVSGGAIVDADRELLILMDAILVLVLALTLYAVSARDRLAPAGLFDVVQLVMLAAAVAVDLAMLTAMLGRIAEFGFSANKTAALGLNLLLLVHLVWHAVLAIGFTRGRTPFVRLERWQTGYLPLYAAWAAVVVVAFPPLFGFA
jgi:hypothetical protein